MNDFLILWLSLSLSGSLVAVALMVLRPLLRRFEKTWQYYLWLLVILRFLIPFSPAESLVGGLFEQVQVYLTTQSSPNGQMTDTQLPKGVQSSAISGMKNSAIKETVAPVNAFYTVKDHALGVLWMGVALLLFVRKAVGYVRFFKTVKSESKRTSNRQLFDALQAACKAMGIRKNISICINPLVRAPMLVGYIRPFIVLPDEAVPARQLAFILRHELTHYRRMDFLYKWLAEIAVCLHWFNPIAYWVRKQINRDCEFSCDEAVIACLDASERRTYGDTLLSSIVIDRYVGRDIASLSLNRDGKLMKERLNAIMFYHRKPKRYAFAAAVLTAVLLCGAVFSGAYPVAAAETVQTDRTARPVQINVQELAPGGSVSLGSQRYLSGTECTVLLSWNGNSSLTVLCTAASGGVESLLAESGKTSSLQIKADGEYTLSIRNDDVRPIANVTGAITFRPSTQPQSGRPAGLRAPAAQTVTYESVEMRRYDGYPELGIGGHPYAHDVKTNNTDKTIVRTERGMTAFDKDGNPLAIKWNGMDTDSKPSYYFMYDWGTEKIAPHRTEDVFGGWSLNFYGTDSSVEKIAYVIYCDKSITFEDGTVWINPNFENWRSTYEGKKVAVHTLSTYYPYEQEITV